MSQIPRLGTILANDRSILSLTDSVARTSATHLKILYSKPIFFPKSCPGNRLRTFSFLGVQVRWASKLRREGIPKETKGTPENTKL